MIQRSNLCLSLALLACLTAGCEDGPALAEVRGLVTEDGSPSVGAMVEFHPEKGRPSTALTGPDGRFELRFTPERMGALPGSHRVKITVGQAGYAALGEPGEPILSVAPPEPAEFPEPVEIQPGKNEFKIEVANKTIARE